MLLGRKTQYRKDARSPQLIYNFHAIPIKIPTGISMELDLQILKFIWKRKRAGIAKKFLQKNQKNPLKLSRLKARYLLGITNNGLMEHNEGSRAHTGI